MEEWKTIEGYPNYMVSNMGRVKSLGNNKARKEKILKGAKNNMGYLQVVLCKEGKTKTYLIHKLVALAFLENPDNLPEINHIDEDKSNNCVSNLEWCNRSYNINYGTHNEKMAKSKSIPILQFSKTGDFIKKWDSGTQIEKELSIKHSNICSCIKGRYEVAGNYKWGYEKDYKRIPFKVFDLNIYEKIA